jgi:hypothetical protein
MINLKQNLKKGEDDEMQNKMNEEDENSSMQQKNKTKGTASKKYSVKVIT